MTDTSEPMVYTKSRVYNVFSDCGKETSDVHIAYNVFVYV